MTVTVLSSMATRRSLADIAEACARSGGPAVAVTSVGGVEAQRRIRAGEAFDVVVLADDAIAALVTDGFIEARSVATFALSPTAVAVRSGTVSPGTARPAARDEASLRALIRGAGSVGLSTGPSGVKVRALLEAWRVQDGISPRLVQAAVGVPVARMLAAGEVDVGFQQLSELMGEPGIDIVGEVPAALVAETVFSMGLSCVARDVDGSRSFLAFAHSIEADLIRVRHGLGSPS